MVVDLQLVMVVHSSSIGKQNMFHFPVQFLLCCLITSLFSDLAHAEPPYSNCSSSSNYTEDSTFVENLNTLLSSLPSNDSVSKIYNTSFGNDPDKVFALYMCLEYLPFDKCHTCISLAISDSLSICPNTKEAVVWEENCQLRYSNENFIGTLNVDGNMPKGNMKNVSDPQKFEAVVNKTLSELAKKAAFNHSLNMYATGEVSFRDNKVNKVVYALVQCTTDLSGANCDKCLQKAIEDVLRAFYFSIGARLLSRSCYVRYEFYPFYYGATDEAVVADNKGGDAGRKVWLITILAIASACLAILLLVSSACFAMRKTKIKGDTEFFGQQELFHEQNDPKAHHEYPYISLASIHVATNKFSYLNKLGEGGFGPVYKGVMRDGKEVAIKRLSGCSEQGVEEFTNEVLLLMKLQHKNLVRLLGFCAEGQEKILVYEYMPNNGLDVILFDSKKRSQLDWGRRVSIINGIARGILYLHEDSRLRIIHRDLKASNVLLDIEMNPKISDFGRARIFAGSDGQANTAIIVGTYGYMAPEYAMEGIYSIKSDVFGFGVLLLEIITGTRNAGFYLTKRAPSLIAYAWKLWDEGKGMEIVDRLLISSFDPDEFSRYLQIALLCVQEDANDRPTMSSVVVMLKSDTVSLTQPEKPAAFSTGAYSDHHNNAGVVGNSYNYLTISDSMPR